MCHHQYSNAKSLGKSFNNRLTCQLNQTIAATLNTQIQIPIDSEGLCIFHSNNYDWKRENNFWQHFQTLIDCFRNSESGVYDFCEIKFPAGNAFKLVNLSFDKFVSFSACHFEDSIKFMDLQFLKDVVFDSSVFEKKVEFSNINFKQGLSFTHSIFKKGLFFKNMTLKDLDLSHVIAKDTVLIDKITVEQPVYFSSSVFENGYFLTKSIFKHFAFFENSKFATNSPYFLRIADTKFENQVDFSNTVIDCICTFENVLFHGSEVSFSNTEFNYQGVNTSSISNHKGTNFLSITLDNEAIINFIGTADKKLFNSDVLFFDEKLNNGFIRFENANFKNLDAKTRERFLELSKNEDSKVIIGTGCLKYRLQTNVIKVCVSDPNQDLVQELTHSFSSYFSHKEGFNLGVEILSKTPEFITLFYFTDEDISEKEFLSRLDKNHFNFLSLIGKKGNINPDEKLPALNLTDLEGLASIHKFLFICKLRSENGVLEHNEIIEIINALNVQNLPVINPNITINVIENHYTQKTLFGVNTHQQITVPR